MICSKGIYAKGLNEKLPIIRIDLNNDDNIDYYLQAYSNTKDTKVILKSKKVKEYKYMKESTYNFELVKNKKSNGLIKVTLHRIDENCVFFIDYFPKEKNAKINLEIVSKDMTKNFKIKKAYKEGLNLKYKESKLSSEKIKNTSLFIKGEKSRKYIRLGKAYYYKPLGYSVFDKKEIDNILSIKRRKEDTFFQYEMPVKKGYGIRYEGILSIKPLINWENNLAYNTLKVMDLNDKKLFWEDGIYYPNMYNYLPRSEESFFKTPSALQIRASYWALNEGELFKSQGISMMYSYASSFNNKNYIPTKPLSQWLYNDFQIGHNFYDTRFNTDTVISLMYYYQKYPDKLVLEKIDNYFEFYLKYLKKYKFKVDDSLYFIPDYMDFSKEKVSNHCSLNHLISEMIALYKYYEITEDENILKTAHFLRDTIINSYDKWIKPDGDLWYAVTNEGKFIKKDYPLVTYNDLKYANSFLKSVDGFVAKEFKLLLNSKRNWAIKKGYIDRVK